MDCENIVGLGLYDNQLTTLPESIGNLKFLTHLSLSDNQLEVLPEPIGNLSSLNERFYCQKRSENLK